MTLSHPEPHTNADQFLGICIGPNHVGATVARNTAEQRAAAHSAPRFPGNWRGTWGAYAKCKFWGPRTHRTTCGVNRSMHV